MDLNERTEGVEILNRHPWELSRTKCVLAAFSRFMEQLHEEKEGKKYVNVGAGDLYFDKALLEGYPKDEVFAVDIAYQSMEPEDERIHKYHYQEEVSEDAFDYAVMMDSLEYIENDAEYVRKISKRIKKGGYFFFTLPASPKLFSDYDLIVKNLRRYSRKTFTSVIARVPELEIVKDYHFYTSLFMVRFLQKTLHLPIDPHHHVTSHWRYNEKGMFTRFLTACLNLDFAVNRLLGKAGIRLPGLSMLVVCKRV